MELRLEREPNDQGTPGVLYLDDARECYTLERAIGDQEFPAISYGRYPLTLRQTYNRDLWCPFGFATDGNQVAPDDPRYRILPHLENVPGHTGIEMHAGNVVKNTKGCVICGFQRSGLLNEVYESRRAVFALVEKLRLVTGPHWITIVDAKAPEVA